MSGDLVLACRPRPLQMERELRSVPPGRNVHQLVELAIAEPHLREHAVVQVDGDFVVHEGWDLVPRPGAMVAVTVVPGGGNDALRIVLSIAVVAIATYATAGLATGPLAGTVFATAVGQAVVGATITAAGLLAVNALVPPAQPKVDDTEAVASYSISGTRNALRPWQPVPLILGRMHYTPPLAAPQVVEPRGSDQVLSGLFCWGYGPVQIEDLSIGDTRLDSYQEVETQTVPGTPGEVASLSIYPQSIGIENIAVQLTGNGGWTVRTTAPDTDKAVVEIQFPRGLIGYGKKTGDKLDQEVTLGIRFRRVGDTAWTDAGDLTTHGTTTSVVRSVKWITFGTRGQYEVGVRRTTSDADDDRHINDSWWVTLRSITNANPVALAGVALTALRIRASKQLSGGVDELRGTVTSICPDWDQGTGTWIARATNNPASLFRWILQHPSRRRPTPDSLLDLPALQAWHERCDELGFTCNLVVDRRAALDETLRTIAACGRGIIRRPDGRWSVVMDEPRDFPVQLFTARNSWGFRARRSFAPVPDAIRFRFTDETNGYVQDERLVYRDDVEPADAVEILDLEQPGVTHPDLAWGHSRYRLAEIIHRPETWELSCDFEHLVCERGDRVQVQHDVILSGVGAGRVKELVLDGSGAVTFIRLDEQIRLEDAPHVLRARRADLSLAEISIDNFTAGVTDLLPLGSPQAVVDCPAIGDLAAVHRTDTVLEDALVLGIRPGDELSARLVLVPYREAVYDAPWQAIPPWQPRVSPAYGAAPVILGVRSDETVGQRDADGSIHLQALVDLFDDGTRPLTTLQGVELRWSAAGTGGADRMVSAPADATEVVLGGVEIGQTVRVAARWRWRDGSAGPWSGEIEHEIVGPSLRPPDVTVIWVDGSGVAWSYPDAPADLAGFRLRYSTTPAASWASALPLGDGLVTVTGIDASELPYDARLLLVVAETSSGLQSATPARIAVDPTKLARRWTLATHDFRIEGWTGELAAGAEIVDGVIRSLDTALFAQPRAAAFAMPRAALWAASSWAAWTYTAIYTCPQQARSGDVLSIDVETAGTVTLSYRWVTDLLLGEDSDLPAFPGDPSLPAFPGDPNMPAFSSLDEDAPRPWLPRRFTLQPRPGEVLQLRVSAAGGAVRAELRELQVLLEAPEITEILPSAAIAWPARALPTTQPFRSLAWVQALLHGGGAAERIEITSKAKPPDGPVLVARDGDGAPVAAIADVTIGGY